MIEHAISALRSIPAGAGETDGELEYHSCSEVDPRGCGGDYFKQLFVESL